MQGLLANEPLEILLRHDHWATARVLAFCSELPRAVLHQRIDLGPGSLHDTVTHIIGAMLRWADRIDGRPLRPSIERPDGGTFAVGAAGGMRPAVPSRSVGELSRLLDEAAADLAGVAARARVRGLGTPFTVAFGDKTYTFSPAAALCHVLTHGTHHRAQCMFMLRMAGAPAFAREVPEIGVADWQAETETAELKPYTPKPHASNI
jgi:uncharacterized damage-inducible protein DinB